MKPAVDPEQQLAVIEDQVRVLAEEALSDYPEACSGKLAGIIMSIWRSRAAGADLINLLEVKSCLRFRIGFLGKEKIIEFEL